MKRLNLLIVGSVLLFAVTPSLSAAPYLTEATITLQKEKNRYEVVGQVSKLIERDGALTEVVIARPRVISAPGKPASFYVGLARSNVNYPNEVNVTMVVSWPKEGEGDFGACTITVKRGDKIVSKSKMRVKVDDT